MQRKFLILAVAIALLVVAVGCSKAKISSQAVPDRPGVAANDVSDGVFGNINDLNAVDEDVQIEEMDINPDELSGLDF